MATPRSYTYQQLDDFFASTPCRNTIDARNDFDPSWEPGDSVDALTYIEAMYDRGDGHHTCMSIVRALDTNERKLFINWALNQIISLTPDGYSRKAAMIDLKDDLVDYVNAPTTPKKNALISTANAIKPITSQEAEVWVANGFRLITLAIAYNKVNGEVMERFYISLAKAALFVGGLTKDQIVRATLTKLEEILDLVDP